jgi:hypothetical protein
MAHIASFEIRIEDTKNMWPHMKSPRTRPVRLWVRSMRAGQRLFLGRSARPTPAITLEGWSIANPPGEKPN